MKCLVFCAEQETSRERDEMKRLFGHTIRLTLSHRCGAKNECNVLCGQSVRICTCCVRRVTVHTEDGIGTPEPACHDATAT